MHTRNRGGIFKLPVAGDTSSDPGLAGPLWSWRYDLHVLWAGTREVARELALRSLAAAAKDPERLKAGKLGQIYTISGSPRGS